MKRTFALAILLVPYFTNHGQAEEDTSHAGAPIPAPEVRKSSLTEMGNFTGPGYVHIAKSIRIPAGKSAVCFVQGIPVGNEFSPQLEIPGGVHCCISPKGEPDKLFDQILSADKKLAILSYGHGEIVSDKGRHWKGNFIELALDPKDKSQLQLACHRNTTDAEALLTGRDLQQTLQGVIDLDRFAMAKLLARPESKEWTLDDISRSFEGLVEDKSSAWW